MALEKTIIKAREAVASAFEYKAPEIGGQEVSSVAKSFVSEQAFTSTDFKISEIISKQAGISQLEDAAHQDKINAQIVERLGEVQEKAYKEGYDLGIVEGGEKGFADSKAALLEKLKELEGVIKKVEELKTRLLDENETEIINLVFLVAKKMALRDLQENREAVVEVIRNIVRESQEGERVNVHLSQVDLTFIETLQQKGDQRMESLQRVKFTASEKVTPGGCIIETDFGNVDATVEERVDRTWKALKDKIPHTQPKKSE